VPLSAGRRALFTAITVLLPFLLLGATELVLRATWPGGAMPLFVPMLSESGQTLLTTNPHVAKRWFMGKGAAAPPGAIPQAFPLQKPANAVRIFAMGESTTAGFPYPQTGTFPRMLEDALRDVLPSNSVQVVNLGIPATNSYALDDEVNEVIAQHPDAVVIYAGHNEFYGALGVGSTQSVLGGAPSLVRAYLRLQRLRLVVAIREGVHWLGTRLAPHADAGHSVTLMETLVSDQEIPLGGPVYERGEHQFQSNLAVLLERLRAAHVPVFIGSQASDVRDQPPFVAAGNARPGGADSVFAQAQSAWTRGDSAVADSLFVRARDLDVVRFRASSDFNAIIRSEARAHGAVYVPVEERIASAAVGGAPGHDLFLEHLHPNVHGITVMARAYYDAIAQAGFLGRRAQPDRLDTWDDYARGLDLTPLDLRIARLSTEAVTTRWPFVPVAAQTDVRRDYRATNLVDSLALEVTAGGSWPRAKLRLAKAYEQRGFADSAVAELRGVVLGSPRFAEPWELLAGAFEQAGQPDSAYDAYRRAVTIRPSATSARAAAEIALRRHDYAAAIPMLEMEVSFAPVDPRTLYQLSLAYAVSHDIPRARATALRLRQQAPDFPGLADWLRTLGIR
jgi:lysophospholipase L1-like esterase